MYLISNQERRDLIRVLGTLKEALPLTDGNIRRANAGRVAGLLIKQLERKQEVKHDLLKAIKENS